MFFPVFLNLNKFIIISFVLSLYFDLFAKINTIWVEQKEKTHSGDCEFSNTFCLTLPMNQSKRLYKIMSVISITKIDMFTYSFCLVISLNG